MGATAAVVGAYVLAGEISQAASTLSKNTTIEDGAHTNSIEDPIKKALLKYEEILRPYMEKAQKLPPGAPDILNPETEWGIWLLHTVLGFVTKTGLAGLLGRLSASTSKEAFELPEYEELCLPA